MSFIKELYNKETLEFQELLLNSRISRWDTLVI